MKLTQPLRLNYEFSRVYHKGRFLTSKHVVLHYLRRPGRANRLGVTVSRKTKGSVRRNRMKRLLRESFRQVEEQLSVGYDLVLVGRDTTDRPDYRTVCQEVNRLFIRAGVCPSLKAESARTSSTDLPEKKSADIARPSEG